MGSPLGCYKARARNGMRYAMNEMTQDKNRSVKPKEAVRIALALPAATIIFIISSILFSIIDTTMFGASYKTHFYLIGFATACSVLIGAMVSPLRFYRKAAHIILFTIIFITVVSFLWDAAHSKPLMSNVYDFVGIAFGYFILIRPFLSRSARSKPSTNVSGPCP